MMFSLVLSVLMILERQEVIRELRKKSVMANFKVTIAEFSLRIRGKQWYISIRLVGYSVEMELCTS
jgi:hypothetical protein